MTPSTTQEPVLRIGRLALSSKAMLAPMAGVCDSPFKRVVRHYDAESLLSTELVNGESWLRGHYEMAQRTVLHPSETPVALQLSGRDPKWLAEAARQCEAIGADLVDLNFGCPSPHIVSSGNGAALLKADMQHIQAIFEAVRAALSGPMTVKMRVGWDEARLTGLAVAKLAEACGADAVWIHGRTAVQGYGGKADWQAVAAIKRELSIPVIGNGDVMTPQDARARLEESGVDAVAIGRGAMGNPWIFKRANHYMLTGELLPEPTLAERLEACRLQCGYLIEEMGERLGVPECRKHVAWYVKGLPETTALRQAVNKAQSQAELESALAAYQEAQDPHETARPERFGTLVDAKWQRYKV